jgi:hypothetical protein
MNPIAAAEASAVLTKQCGNRASRFINPSGRNYKFELQVIYARVADVGKVAFSSCCLFIHGPTLALAVIRIYRLSSSLPESSFMAATSRPP